MCFYNAAGQAFEMLETIRFVVVLWLFVEFFCSSNKGSLTLFSHWSFQIVIDGAAAAEV